MKKKISFDLDKDKYIRLKLMALELETTVSKLLREAIDAKYNFQNEQREKTASSDCANSLSS